MARVSLQLFALLIFPALLAAGKDKARQVYPFHGTVIAMRTVMETHGGGVYTDPYGKTHGGAVHSEAVRVYTVHTGRLDYDIEARRGIKVGDQLNFRLTKNRVWVQRAHKEDWYSLVGERLASSGATSKSTGPALTNQDILKLQRAGLSGSVIVEKIKTSPGNYKLGTENLISLKEAGLSDAVISAMLAASSR